MKAALSIGLAIVAFGACTVQVDADPHDAGATGGSASQPMGGAGPGPAGTSGTPGTSPEAGAAGATNGMGGAAGNSSEGGEPSGGASGTQMDPDASSAESGAAGESGVAGAAGAAADAGAAVDAGAAADAGGPDASTVPPGVCHLDDSGVVVQYTDRTSGVSSFQLSMSLVITTAVPASRLSELTLRYWFNADGVPVFTADVDYATLGNDVIATSDVTVEFGSVPASDYAQVSFALVEPQSDPIVVEQLQLRLHSPDYQTIDQGNDFSFLKAASGAVNRNISVYLAGELIAGCEPQ